MKKLSLDEYIAALEKMKTSPRDRLGILGELAATGIGAVGGIAASGTAAGIAGATTLAGSTKLAALFGSVFVTTTPVGWVIGAAIVGAGLGHVATKLIKSGLKVDLCKARTIQELEERISTLQRDALTTKTDNEKYSDVISAVQVLVINESISQAKGTQILTAVSKNEISVSEAFELLQGLMKEHDKVNN